MAKVKISSSDLTWIFTEALKSSSEDNRIPAVAIVPAKNGWMAVTNARVAKGFPLQAKRVERLQKRLRKIYVLAKD
jgi:hypothetical protein